MDLYKNKPMSVATVKEIISRFNDPANKVELESTLPPPSSSLPPPAIDEIEGVFLKFNAAVDVPSGELTAVRAASQVDFSVIITIAVISALVGWLFGAHL